MNNNFDNNSNNSVENESLETAKSGMKLAKKPILNFCKKAIKVAIKIIGYIIKSILAILGPWLLVIIGVFFVFWVIYDEVFDSKGTEQDLQSEDTKYSNDTKIDPKDGDYKNTDVSKENRMLRAFYTVKSEDSYYVQLDNGRVVSGSSKEAQKLKDKYGREKMFYLNPDMLWTLDETLNNNKFRYPEQFLKPVDYDKDSFKLKQLTDKNGDLVAESTDYTQKDGSKDYSKTDKKVKGVWDYGFASVLKYKKFEETKKINGTYNKETYYNKKTGKVEWKDIHEKFTASYDGYPKDVNLITDAVTPAGTIVNKIKFDEQTNQVALKPGTGAVASDSQDVVVGQETTDEYGWVEKTRYEKRKVKKTVPLTEEVIDPNTGVKTIREVQGKTKEIEVEEKVPVKYKDWDKTGNKVTFDVKKRKSEDTQVTQRIPQYDGEPDPKEITGNKYFFEYMQNYKTYIPKNALDKFDFEKRTGKSEDSVFDIPVGGDESTSAFPGGSISGDFNAGAGASGDSYKKSLQYLPQAQSLGAKYGVDPAFIIAMICKESSGNPNDDNGIAYGLMQYNYRDNPSTVTIRDANGGTETLDASMSALRGNPEQQIKVGIAEMQQKLDVVGDKNILAMLVAYNMGEGNLANQFVKPYLSSIGKNMNPFKYLATGDNGWFKYEQEHASGEAKVDLQHLFNYYKSVDGSKGPWMINKQKQKVSVDISNGSIGISAGSGVTQDPTSTPSQLSDGGIGSWLKSCYGQIKASIEKLFTDIEYSDKRFEYSNKLSTAYSQNTVNLFFALQDKKRFSDVGDITDKDWQTRYKELFKNPLGDDISGASVPQVNPNEYFTNGEFTSPVENGSIIKAFGLSGSNMSNGIVISATKGAKAYSVANDGKVTEVGSNDKYGKYVVVEYSNDTQIIYGNLESTSVKKGDTVKKSQEIGKVGDTKTSSINANGLYLELHHKGTVQDPSWIVTGITGGGMMGNGGMPIPADASETAKKVIGEAKKYLGSPYAWGGKQPPSYVNGKWECKQSGYDGSKPLYSTGFDCSGLVGWAMKHGAGIDIGWSTYDQVKHGTPISSSQLKPGDVIFIGGNTSPHHVMLYEGNMTAIEAPHTGDVVKERKFSNFGSDWVYRRVLPDVH